MEQLIVIRDLQKTYQSKFAELIALHNLRDAHGLETPEYFKLRDEWIKVGDDIRKHLEKLNLQ
jgi:hypothetical protein